MIDVKPTGTRATSVLQLVRFKLSTSDWVCVKMSPLGGIHGPHIDLSSLKREKAE